MSKRKYTDQTKKTRHKGNILISLSKEHGKFKDDVKSCFTNLDVTVKADYFRMSADSLPMLVVILLGSAVLSGLTWDLLKLGIKNVHKRFKDAQVEIRDTNSIMYAVFPNGKVNVIVIPDRYSEFKHIKTLNDLVSHLKKQQNKWQTKKLGEICEVFDDGDWIEKKDQSLNGIRLIQTGNVGNGIFKDRIDKARYISEKTFKRLQCTEIFPGDCLVSRLPDPVGRSCIIPDKDDKMITAVDCTIIRFKKKVILPEWFINFSLSQEYQTQINKEVGGATRQRISRKKLDQIEIPLPPISEQKRIVKLLDETFEKIEKAKENTEKNINNAKDLFESYLNNLRGNKELLGALVDVKTGKLDANAAKENGKYPFFTCSREIFAIDNYAFDCEAILLAGNNAVGDFNVKHYRGKFNAYQRTYIITINKDNKISYRYLYFQLLKSLKEFKAKSVGAGTKFLKLGMIKNLQVLLPSKKDQKIIVEKLDSLLKQTKKMEEIYNHKLLDLEELKKSILKRAFNGEL